MKYVIAEIKGLVTPFIFPDFVDHGYIFEYKPGVKIISAGKFSIHSDVMTGYTSYNPYGESTSLKVKSRPEDADIIKHAFEFEG